MNVFAGPAQPTARLVKVGVTTIVATTGVIPPLTAAKAAILPDPAAARPMPGALFVHV